MLPTSNLVYISSPQFQQAVLTNISQVNPIELFCQSLFNIYNGASRVQVQTCSSLWDRKRNFRCLSIFGARGIAGISSGSAVTIAFGIA